MHIGEKIKMARKAKGITAAKLSRQSKISQSYLCLIEKGRARGFKVDALRRICNVLDISPNELMEWEEVGAGK